MPERRSRRAPAMRVAQDQSEIFNGTGAGRAAQGRPSSDGNDTRAIPAFVFGEELADLADHDPRVVVLTADLARANRATDFARAPPRPLRQRRHRREEHDHAWRPGWPACGYVPFAATFASFAALLGCEQIRTDCAYPQMPVRVVGHHSGHVHGLLRHEPPQPRGPRHHAQHRRPHRRVRHRRQPPARAAARLARPSRRDVHPARSRSRPARSTTRCRTLTIGKAMTAARRARTSRSSPPAPRSEPCAATPPRRWPQSGLQRRRGRHVHRQPARRRGGADRCRPTPAHAHRRGGQRHLRPRHRGRRVLVRVRHGSAVRFRRHGVPDELRARRSARPRCTRTTGSTLTASLRSRGSCCV